MGETAIELQGVGRAFGALIAVDGLDLTVPRGSIFGLIGPNGAGKTTTVRMIVGHLHPGKGTVRVLGEDPWRHDEATRRRIAYVSENMALPGWMTPRAACGFCAPLYPRWDAALADALLGQFGLGEAGAFATLSKGQKRAACIVLALAQRADLLVMDEPASGLDASARRDFLERLLDTASEDGRTVLISSHIITDLERVVDRVGIVCGGRMRLAGELDTLKSSARKLLLPGRVDAQALGEAFDVLRCESTDSSTEAVVTGYSEEKLRALCAELGCGAGARDYGLNLEDLFVELTRSEKNNVRA
jgi:ABC-2 type transport system ATP-binding protein